MGNMFGRGFESHQLHLITFMKSFLDNNGKLFFAINTIPFEKGWLEITSAVLDLIHYPSTAGNIVIFR